MSGYVQDDPQPYFDKRPEGGAKVWRYLSFAKFAHMLRTKTLHFTRVDKFSDHFEGFWPKRDLEAWRNRLSEGEYQIQQSARPHFAALCWNCSEIESAAMWRLYGDGSESLAIATTFEKLEASIPIIPSSSKGSVFPFAGSVRYLDHFRDSVVAERKPGEWRPNALQSVTFKHQSYEHEKEVRILLLRQGEHWPDGGTDIEFAPLTLINRVILNPFADDWFRDAVCNEMRAYNMTERVVRSELAPKSFYAPQ